MKIAYLSDTHLEHGGSYTPSQAQRQADVMVLAGDIGKNWQGALWGLENFSQPIIYVPGNHEFYGRERLNKVQRRLRELGEEHPRFHPLIDHTSPAVNIDGVVFCGATLWADFYLYDSPVVSRNAAQDAMNDYRAIKLQDSRHVFRRLKATDTQGFHAQQRAAIERHLQAHAQDTVVVVTHHAPSERSIDTRYAGDPCTPAYASHLDALIEAYQPAAWIHGHVHWAQKYQIGRTWVACNPFGYSKFGEYTGFSDEACLDIAA